MFPFVSGPIFSSWQLRLTPGKTSARVNAHVNAKKLHFGPITMHAAWTRMHNAHTSMHKRICGRVELCLPQYLHIVLYVVQASLPPLIYTNSSLHLPIYTYHAALCSIAFRHLWVRCSTANYV